MLMCAETEVIAGSVQVSVAEDNDLVNVQIGFPTKLKIHHDYSPMWNGMWNWNSAGVSGGWTWSGYQLVFVCNYSDFCTRICGGDHRSHCKV